MIPAPLAGVRVLEVAGLLAGPMVGRKLADLGADVVKIEPPTGDPSRAFAPVIEGRSILHEATNRGKRSVVLDLRQPPDRDRLLALADVSNVVIDANRPNVLVRWGIEWGAVRARRPSLVVCSITGFGLTGPLADLPAHGMIIEALAGCAQVVEANGNFRLSGELAVSMELGVLNGALATIAAVLRARTTGVGVWLDVSSWDAGVEAHRWTLYPRLVGHEPNGLDGEHGPLQGLYRSADGTPVLLMLVEKKFWRSFCARLGRDDLLDRYIPRDYYARASFAEDESLRRELEAIIATAPAEEWTRRFIEWQVPGCVVLRPEQMLAHEHFKARHLLGTSPDTMLPCVADPVRYVEDESRPGQAALGAPALGEHTATVLDEWLT